MNQVIEGSLEDVFSFIRELKNSGVKAKDIIILTPYDGCNRTVNKEYIETINKEFQNIYDIGNKYVIDDKGIKFMIFDQVMHIGNDLDNNISHGEIGTISDIIDDKIIVNFNGKYYDFFINSKNLRHAFCIALFRSQGLEWPYTITIISEPVNDKEIYTAITRGEKSYLVTLDINYLNAVYAVLVK